MSSPQLVLYGHFGVGNLGNDSTLEAMLYNIRKYQPSANIICVCTGPQVVTQRYGIDTLPIDIAEDRNIRQQPSGVLRKAIRVTTRIIDEINFWLKRVRWFRSIDQFLVVGTGALDDMAVIHPWNAPYDLFKWCHAAKLGGAKVVFLSVGAGPIENRISRALMLSALRVANYRSYRDLESQEYLRNVGFETLGDSLYPDLVFSLPEKAAPYSHVNVAKPRVVGLGVINYYGWRHDTSSGEPIYQGYLAKLKHFIQWLLAQGYAVRLLSGDSTDQRPVDELLEFIRTEGQTGWQNYIFVEPIADLEDLLEQIAKTDIVVASRFHNLLCALMLGRPVVSIGYHSKNDALLTEMGLQAYCQHIENFDVDRLIQQFQLLSSELPLASHRIQQKCDRNRELLEEQYRRIFLAESEPEHVPPTTILAGLKE
jgi:polysaccharide pyruvyl transferase WcaK-like protein